ncbi:MAG: hypothetical protein ACRCZD_06810 [Phycicoccus sp.]
MTWQSSAVRYVSIGERSARFRDLVLPFAVGGEPVETVIWLPNGGGKSSLMSMHSAVVLPAARDFTGAGREDGEKRPRRLDDYVGNGDTSHTVIEWSRTDEKTLVDGQRKLLTGAVYEWPDRHRPGPEASVTLNKLWWSAVPAAGLLDLDHLPVRDGRLLTLNQFRDRLRTLNTRHPELQISFATTQNQWEEQLADLGIDTALHRYQARMNTSEGGIAKVFNFNTVKDFIDLVVDVIARPQQATDCAAVVKEHAKNLFRRPVLQTERAFLTDAKVLLDELEAAHEIVLTATVESDQARAAAVRLRSALSQAAVHQDTASQIAAGRATTLVEQVAARRRERGQVEAVRAELLYLAAKQVDADAATALTGAQAAETEARADQTAWTVAAALADAASHERVAAELREQLKPERAEREALRVRVDIAALAARDLLGARGTILNRQAADAAGRAADARTRLSSIAKNLRIARDEVTDLGRTEAAADARLKDHDRAMAAVRRDGVLGVGESLAEGVTRLQQAVAAADKTAAEHDAAEIEYRAAAEAAAGRLIAARGEQTQLEAEAESAQREETHLRDTHARLAGHDRLIALAEADGQVNVWGDAGRLRSALADAFRESEDAALREAVEAAEDDRLLAGVDSAGLLPAPVATIAVVAALNSAGVPAQTAWDVLARDYPEPDRLRAASTRPDVATGVVVQDGAARDRALVVLATDPTLAHVTLVTAAELADAAHGTTGSTEPTAAMAPLPSVPLHEGLHLPDSATAAADQLRIHGQDRRQRQAQLVDRARSDRDLLDRLSKFLITYPDSDSLELAAQAARTARDAARSKQDEAAAFDRARKEHEDAASQRRCLAQQATREATEASLHLTRLKALAEADTQAAQHRETIRATQTALVEANGRVSSLENDREQATEVANEADLERQNRERDATAATTQAGSIRVLEPNSPPPDADVAATRDRGLTDAVASYATLIEQWTTESSASVLEDRLKASEQSNAAAIERGDRALAGHTPDRDDGTTRPRAQVLAEIRAVAERRAATHTATQCEGEAATARNALEHAITGRANAVTAAANASDALATATTTRNRTQRVTEPVEFTTAADARDRAAYLLTRMNDLGTAADQAEKYSAKVAQEAKDAADLAENLRDQGARLPADPVPDDLASVEAFPGDLPAARAAVARTLAKVADTAGELTTAKEQRAQYSSEALKLATNKRYAELPLALRERLADSDPIRLGAKAHEYADEVTTRLAHVVDLLAQIGEDERRISSLVASHVNELLSALQSAARASKLPAGLGELSGHQFISLRLHNPSDEELHSRVTQELLAMLDSAHGETKSLPSGQQILRRGVHAAVGVKGFRVNVLKPNEHMLEQRVPVVDVARFSDGERLTTCVLLFCAFARMRQQGRSGGATGTLMLDNPFGQASTAQLVALQLAVAKAQRVHLVYATGLEDMGALLQFRRLIRLRNRKPVGTSDGHVQLEKSAGRVGEVAGVTVARPTAPVPDIPHNASDDEPGDDAGTGKLGKAGSGQEPAPDDRQTGDRTAAAS